MSFIHYTELDLYLEASEIELGSSSKMKGQIHFSVRSVY